MCTTARLVQAGTASRWLGMPHGAAATDPSVTIQPGADAYLEVRYDPAAHGPAGVGPTRRGIFLRTDGGQELNFEINAVVTPPRG